MIELLTRIFRLRVMVIRKRNVIGLIASIFLAMPIMLAGTRASCESEDVIDSTAPDAVGAIESRQDTYIGNVDSMKFHLSTCEYAKSMARKRRVAFATYSKAKEAGMSACNWCFPRWEMRVEGQIIFSSQKNSHENRVTP